MYASFFAGSTANQRGPWLTWLDELFGIRHRARYGLVEPIEDDEVVFDFVEELGEIEAGSALRFVVGGTASARSYLPVDLAGARVVAFDGHGRPALLRYELGEGTTFFSTYPLEHMAARTANVNPESTWQLYSALATAAGVSRPVRVHDPRVVAGTLRGRRKVTAVYLNTSADPLTFTPIVEGAAVGAPLSLGPYEAVAVARDRQLRGEAPAPLAPDPSVAANEGRDPSA